LGSSGVLAAEQPSQNTSALKTELEPQRISNVAFLC
jgi:hypothetical protein